MDDYLFHFWWLVFPIMWFVFGMFRMMMRANEHRAMLDMMKTLADQGKDPTEAMKAMGPGYGPRYRRW